MYGTFPLSLLRRHPQLRFPDRHDQILTGNLGRDQTISRIVLLHKTFKINPTILLNLPLRTKIVRQWPTHW